MSTLRLHPCGVSYICQLKADIKVIPAGGRSYITPSATRILYHVSPFYAISNQAAVSSIYRNASLNLCKTLKCFVFFIDYGNIIGNSKKGRQC